ncbi:MAG: hypothetical protein KC912_18680 [Proteobacteria bacterium]|nr:hypothetical protein [Pseudomonadota bacterium]
MSDFESTRSAGRRMVRATLGLAALALAAPLAHAQESTPLRVVVVSKVTADGQTRDAGPLDAWVHGALKDAGHRVVDLDSSLRSQSFALSDALASGQVPDELTVLNADAAWSVQLACEKDSGSAAAMGLTYYCTLTRHVIRISQGDTVYSDSVSWHDIFGANFGQALFGGNVKKRSPDLLASDVTAWTGEWKPTGPWDVDLKVSGLRDRAQAEAIADRLAELPGITGARLGAFSRTVSQFMLRGEGIDALEHLGEHIESDRGLGLAVTHQSDRLLHAEMHFGRLNRRSVRVQVIGPKSPAAKSEAAVVAASAPTLVRSALANLTWVDVESVSDKSPMAEAKAAEDPYFAVVTYQDSRSDGDTRWLVTASLKGTGGGEVLTATGNGADPYSALDTAVRDLDARFTTAIDDPGKRAKLGLPSSVGEGLAPQAVEIGSFDLSPLFPARAREATEQGVGSLSITNGGETALTGATLEIRGADQVLATLEVPDIPAGSSHALPVRLESLPELDPEAQHAIQLSATLSYKLDDSFGRSRAYASLTVHRRNTVDWRQPRSVAAFVDPADSTVRDLSTAATAGALPDGVPTKALGRAAAVHTALWSPELRYVPDPVQTSFADSIDEVQHPRQTLARLTGDCDDLTVLMASMFEAVGLGTVIITTPGHVLLGVDTGLRSGGHLLLGLEADRFIEVDGALFVPVEATAMSVDFTEAWTLGADLIGKSESFEAFRTRDAWRDYPTIALPNAEDNALEPTGADPSTALAALPAMTVPATPPDSASPMALSVLAWMGGSRKAGLEQALTICESGVGESCYNLGVMLAATSKGEAQDASAFAQIEAAFMLLPRPVMRMLLESGGMADDATEASEDAAIERRLESVLEKARKRQEQMEAEGLTDAPLETDAMAGRRGAPQTEEEALAPLFFYAPASL